MVRQPTAPTGYGLVQVPKQAGFRLPPIYQEEDWGEGGKPQIDITDISRFQVAYLQTAVGRVFRRPETNNTGFCETQPQLRQTKPKESYERKNRPMAR